MERQIDINLKFLDIIKAKRPESLMQYKLLCDNYNQFANAEPSEVDAKYKDLHKMRVSYNELRSSLSWLSEIGILMRRIIGDANDDSIRDL